MKLNKNRKYQEICRVQNARLRDFCLLIFLYLLLPRCRCCCFVVVVPHKYTNVALKLLIYQTTTTATTIKPLAADSKSLSTEIIGKFQEANRRRAIPIQSECDIEVKQNRIQIYMYIWYMCIYTRT